jgi:hypothetical protein
LVKEQSEKMDKREPSVGDKVTILGPNGAVLDEEYMIERIVDKNVLRVVNSLNVPMRIHKSRVAAIVGAKGNEEEASMDSNVPEAAVAEEEVKVKPAAVVAEEVKAKPTPKAKKEPKVKKAFEKFDAEAWFKENGWTAGTHLAKKCEFDAKKVYPTAHVAVNPTTGRYHTINVYTYPADHPSFPVGGDSLGKSNKGGCEYALKGHKFTYEVKKQDGTKEKKQHVGDQTAEEVVAALLKKGYKQVK